MENKILPVFAAVLIPPVFVVVLILVTTKVKWINQSTYKISDFNRHHDSTAHEDDLSELTPQVPLKNSSVHSTTTYKCSFAFQSSCNNNNQDAASHCASRTSSENGIDSSFKSSEWNLDALYGMPTIDEFHDYYTDDDLPEYAIILGSTVSSHNRRAASRAYRDVVRRVSSVMLKGSTFM